MTFDHVEFEPSQLLLALEAVNVPSFGNTTCDLPED